MGFLLPVYALLLYYVPVKRTGVLPQQLLLCSYSVQFSRSVVSGSLAALWTVDCQAPLSMGFRRQEYWSGLPFPSPGHLPDPGIEPASPTLQADSLPPRHQGSPFIQVNPGLITVQGTKISHQDCSLLFLQDEIRLA